MLVHDDSHKNINQTLRDALPRWTLHGSTPRMWWIWTTTLLLNVILISKKTTHTSWTKLPIHLFWSNFKNENTRLHPDQRLWTPPECPHAPHFPSPEKFNFRQTMNCESHIVPQNNISSHNITFVPQNNICRTNQHLLDKN